MARRVWGLTDNPPIAALFFRLFDLLPCPPDDRMPPEQSGCKQFQQTDLVIASGEVSQFVSESRRAGLGIQTLGKVRREQQFCVRATAPQHG